MSKLTPTAANLTVPALHAASSSTAPRPFILVPLYIYPAPGAWDPLYTAAARHADAGLDFYAIVNPDNGPGTAAKLPDANYVAALERLTALPNVRVIGYVHCSYGLREADEIVRDVERYAGWEGESVRAGGEVSSTLSPFSLLEAAGEAREGGKGYGADTAVVLLRA